MVAVEKNQPATIQNANEPVKLQSCQSRISSAEFFYSTSQFLAHGWQSLYFRNCEGLHTKGRLGRCSKSLLLCFIIQCQFACGAGPSTGRGVVRASCICSAKIKTVKISSEKSGHISVKFCTSRLVVH